jgi:Domain of unknown function (DUF4148)
MKSLIKAVALAVIVAAPIASFAQSNQPVTRAEVRAELAQLTKAGYNPGAHDPYYPSDIQAAESRVSSTQVAAAPAATADVGGVSGTVRAGGPANVAGMKSIYFGQ